MRVIKLTAPSAWASCLINGDASSLSTEESGAVEAWLIREGLGTPVDCEDAGFIKHHDAFQECPYAADCQTYTFLIDTRRNIMKHAQIGTVSHGTLRSEDLIATFAGELTHYVVTRLDELGHAEVKRIGHLLREAQMYRLNDNPDFGCELVQDLSEALNAFAAPGCYFGAHEGDGSDFGFWPIV